MVLSIAGIGRPRLAKHRLQEEKRCAISCPLLVCLQLQYLADDLSIAAAFLCWRSRYLAPYRSTRGTEGILRIFDTKSMIGNNILFISNGLTKALHIHSLNAPCYLTCNDFGYSLRQYLFQGYNTAPSALWRGIYICCQIKRRCSAPAILLITKPFNRVIFTTSIAKPQETSNTFFIAFHSSMLNSGSLDHILNQMCWVPDFHTI